MNPRSWGSLALGAVVSFVTLLAALHFIEPEFDPSRRLISEYELGRYGWVMTTAFLSLGVGVLATLLSTWDASAIGRSRIGRSLFLIISAALFGGGIFYPYMPPNFESYIHGICGVIVIVTFPVAAALYSSGLVHSPVWIPLRARLRWATVAVWLGLLVFAGSTIVLGSLSQPADRVYPDLLIGWQNRFMILTYALWLTVVAWSVVFPRN